MRATATGKQAGQRCREIGDGVHLLVARTLDYGRVVPFGEQKQQVSVSLKNAGWGSLLDHSLVHFSSSMRDGGHGASDIPQLLVGGAAGRHRPGVVEAAKDTPVGGCNLGVMQMLGLEIGRFGEATRPVRPGRALFMVR